MKRSGSQYKLFDAETRLLSGLRYKPDFITEDEEELLIAFIAAQALTHARGGLKGKYAAKRRHTHFGWGYDYKNEKLVPGPPLPRFLERFARRIEKWLDLSRGTVVEALINEYAPGTALGFHRDNEKFEHVIGLSLAGWARMRFRPLEIKNRNAKNTLSVEMEPRSAYVMQGEVRWNYQHAVAATRVLRYSITFRTLPKGYRPLRFMRRRT